MCGGGKIFYYLCKNLLYNIIMKAYFSKIWKLVLSSILALTGFSALSAEDGDDVIRVMYGPAPVSDRVVLVGNVTDSVGNPVPDVYVTLRCMRKDFDKQLLEKALYTTLSQTQYTNAKGRYEFSRDNGFDQYRIVIEDPAGNFEADSVTIEPEIIPGKTTIETVNIKLKKK